jgi:outer membrane receptor protein involved in Fe transport
MRRVSPRRPSIVRFFATAALTAAACHAPAPALADEPSPAGDDAARSTVRGRRAPPRTASAREVDAQTLAAAPRVQRAEDLLRLVPGLLVIAHGAEGKGEQLFLRGFDAGHGQDVEIRVEGLPVNELSHVHGQGYVDLGFAIPEVVSGLTAHKGPFRLDQGNFALAGTVDFQLGLPREARGQRLKIDVGTTGRVRGVTTYAPRTAPPRASSPPRRSATTVSDATAPRIASPCSDERSCSTG